MATQSRKSPDTLTKSQYHHFIPRFLLRNFAKDVTDEPSASLGKGKRSKRHRNSDELVNILNFQNAIPSQRRIAKKFGLVDMYRDRAIADQHDLEEKLSKLEAQAGVIVSKARKALDGGFELVLTRFERDTIRNFFFMMKYRSSRQFERFNHQSIDTYDADDKDRLIGFLEKRNLSSPKAVWFSNIHTFLDLQMDADMNRLRRILESPLVYPDDAMMFITHMQTKFMAFCTVSDMTDEFVLSQNAYGVHEGPMDIHLDPKSGKLVEGTYTEHHTFAPLSPKLLVVFRSFWLPSGADEGDTHEQKLYYDMFKDVHFNPGEASSILGDLPVEKCRNSYSSVINGKAVLNPGPPEPRSKNKFFFRFFSLSTTHVQLINTIFFENAYRTSSMVFKSSTSMLRARRLFLEDRRRGFKVVKDSSDTRLKFLQKLETIAREMGIETKAVYTVLDMPMPESHMARFVGYIVGFSCVKKDTELGNLYGRLCKGICHPSFQSFSSR